MEHIHNTLTVPCGKSRMISYSSSIMKTIIACNSRFPVKSTYYFAFGPASNACCLLKSIASI